MKKIFEGLIFEWIDGRTYHLGISDTDISSFILTMGSNRRLESVRDKLDVLREGGERLNWVLGYYRDILIFAFNSGMGVGSASIAYTEVLKKVLDNALTSYIVRIGTAGSLNPEVKEYSIVIADAAVRNEHASTNIIYPEYPSNMDPIIYLTALSTSIEHGYKMGENLFLGKVETKDDLYFQEGFHNSPLNRYLEERYEAYMRMGVLASEMEVSILPILRDYFKSISKSMGINIGIYVGGIFLILGENKDKEEIAREEDKLIHIGLDTLYNIDKFFKGEYRLDNILRYISG